MDSVLRKIFRDLNLHSLRGIVFNKFDIWSAVSFDLKNIKYIKVNYKIYI